MQLTPVDKYVEGLSQPLSGARCLITGASGFIGRNLIAHLLEIGAEVHIVVNRRGQHEIPLGENTKPHKCDLTSLKKVEDLFESVKPEYVFHLATPRGDGANNNRDMLLDGNVIVTDRIIRACLRHRPRKIIVANSSLEYGQHFEPLNEDATLKPTTMHGATKAASSMLFQQAYYEYDLPIVILRIFSVYGYWEPWKRLIPTTMKALLEGMVLPLTNGDYHRDFVFMTDMVEALVRAAIVNGVDGEIVNIGSSIQTSNERIVQIIENVSGLTLAVDKGAYSPHTTDTAFWCSDNSKALELLDWSPRHSLSEGISKTWKWFCDVAPHYAN